MIKFQINYSEMCCSTRFPDLQKAARSYLNENEIQTGLGEKGRFLMLLLMMSIYALVIPLQTYEVRFFA